MRPGFNPHIRIAKLHERMNKAGHPVGRAWVSELFKDLGGYINDLARRERRDVRDFAALELEIAEQALQEDRLAEQGITPATSAEVDASVDEALAKAHPAKGPTFEELSASLLDEMLKKI